MTIYSPNRMVERCHIYFFWSCYIYPCVNHCLKNLFFGWLGFLSVILKEDIVIACERIYISSLLILGWKWIIFLKVCFIPQQNINEVWIQSIPAYKTYLHVTGIIVHFSELSRCIWKLNWVDSRSPSCFWLIELCERNKNLDPPLIFCWLRILWELSISWFLQIGLILDPPRSSC